VHHVLSFAGHVLAVIAGVLIIGATLGSAVKTVMMPRVAVSRITRVVFLGSGKFFNLLAPRSSSFEWRDRVLGYYAPVSLVVLLVSWLFLVELGYTLLYLGLGRDGFQRAEILSGSSLFTLGIARPPGTGETILVFTEAAIGLFLLALLITYLPTIYAAFSRREVGVNALEVRAGSPPSGREMIERYWRLERIHALTTVWEEWERWFADVEETHTSLAVLNFFRSPLPRHSWVTSAGAVLDGASLLVSTVDVPHDVQADICIRAGYLCLRRIADYFGFVHPHDPAPDDPISISREEWEEVVAHMEEVGVPIKPNRDQAWRDFAGWRVNYDAVLISLADMTTAPYAPWSSDRAGDRSVAPRLIRLK
jgi:hypothetical protein